MAYLSALIAGVALLVLAVLLVMVLGSVRQFRAAVRNYRARLDVETRVLQAGRDELNVQLGQLRRVRSRWRRRYDRLAGNTEDHDA